MLEFRAVVYDIKPSIIMLCETFTRDDISKAFLSIDGYELIVRKDGTDTTRGIARGLLVYCRSDFKAAEFDDPVMDNFTECAGIQIPVRNQESIKIILVYRPPRNPFSESDSNNTAKLCHILKSVKGPALFLGDFNFPGIDWDLMHSDNEGERHFINILQDQFFTQHVDFPTQDKGNILDLVISSSSNLVHSVDDCGKLGKGDHRLLKVNLRGISAESQSRELVPNWAKADLIGMRESISNIVWDDVLSSMSGDEAWVTFKNILETEFSKFVPKKLRRYNSKPLWMTKNILRLIRKKRRLWRWYTRNGGRDYDSFLNFKKVQREVQNSVRRARRNFERSLAQQRKSNSKAFFSHIKKCTANRVTVGPLKQGDDIVSDSGQMATVLNDFFCSVFTEESVGALPQVEQSFSGDDPLVSVTFNRCEIEKKLLNLKKSASPGPDNLWPRVLQSLADVLSAPLLIIYTRCLDERVVPADWRRAHITPIYKKGSKSTPGNYRPVSLTSVLCKIMESIMRDAIVVHLTRYKLIRESQHGFMRGRSCLTNLLEYLEEMTKLLDSGKSVDIVYLDFAKAFDKVPIKRLISKCEGLGIGGNLLGWIHQWLSGRKQRVVLNGEFSEWRPVGSGVPQGSVLGPTLFLIYINDIDNAVQFTSSVLKKFADDTKWGMVVENMHDRMMFQQGLDNLMEWSNEWQMLFNVEKCHIIHAGRNNNGFQYTMNGRTLDEVDSEKDVGVLLHKSFKPSFQCARAAAKANAVLGQLSRGISYRDSKTFISLYKTFVRPHLEYCSQAWSPWNKADIEVLEAVQRRAIMMVTNLRGRSYEERLAELEMVTLEKRRLRGDLIQAYKVLSGKDDVNASTWFNFPELKDGQVTTRAASGVLNVVRNEGRSDIRRNFWSVRVCDPWNHLPEEVKMQSTTNGFKNALDGFLFG